MLAFLFACGSDNGGAVPDGGGTAADTGECAVQATFTSLHDDLFATTRCAIPGCHASNSSQGDLDYEGGKAAVYDALLNRSTFNAMARGEFPNRVVMNDPNMSYLYEKVSEANPAGGGSGRMPPGIPLADCEIQAIRDWIMGGAPND